MRLIHRTGLANPALYVSYIKLEHLLNVSTLGLLHIVN